MNINKKILNEINLLLEYTNRSHTIRSSLKPGQIVDIVLKKDQPTGYLTRGKIKKILSPGVQHHRGIKVMLVNGQVGRVQHIIR